MTAEHAAATVAGGFRGLPSVDALARHPRLVAVTAAASVRTRAARAVLEAERRSRESGAPDRDADGLADDGAAWLRSRLDPGPHRVLNATGTVVHTNLGRAPLSAEAVAATVRAAGSTDLEYDLTAGSRGSRHDHVAPLLATLCAAEDALVVTNNAAAVLLALRALCRGGEVLVSRGEAIEIGGGFRIPDILRESGARLVDVGTTNRTRAADYAAAVTPRTAAILRVHPSNFAMRGFTGRPATAEVAAVARAHGLLLLEDCGSGTLTDPGSRDVRLGGEPGLAATLAGGADLVTGSGDKLCGGPQAGLVAGRAVLVARLRRHPLLRALRPDKLVLAALGATLAAHLRGDALETVPVLRMLVRPLDDIAAAAAAMTARLAAAGLPAEVVEDTSRPGGGAYPDVELPTVCIALPGPTGRLLAALRAAEPPVVARAGGGRVLLDARTLATEDADDLVHAVAAAWHAVHPRDGRGPVTAG